METKHGTIIDCNAFHTQFQGLNVHKKPSVEADGYADLFDFEVFWGVGISRTFIGFRSIEDAASEIDNWIHERMNHEIWIEEQMNDADER